MTKDKIRLEAMRRTKVRHSFVYPGTPGSARRAQNQDNMQRSMDESIMEITIETVLVEMEKVVDKLTISDEDKKIIHFANSRLRSRLATIFHPKEAKIGVQETNIQQIADERFDNSIELSKKILHDLLDDKTGSPAMADFIHQAKVHIATLESEKDDFIQALEEEDKLLRERTNNFFKRNGVKSEKKTFMGMELVEDPSMNPGEWEMRQGKPNTTTT